MNLELRLLLRSPLLIAAALAAALVTTLALLAGIAQVRHVDATMHEAVAFDARALDDARAKASDAPLDAGLFGYGTLFAVPHPVAPGAWFNLGDTLAQPAVQRLRLLGLQGQVHDGTGGNPAARAAGTFDAAFVVAVLLPLLAVAVFAPLAAEEREARRDGLLAALVASPRSFWLKRVVVRSLVVLVPVLGPILVALWALAALVLPALGGLALDRLAPAVPGSAIALAHRDAVNGAWDRPKDETFEAFFAHHPEWRGTPPVTGRFHWKWYFAFHAVADWRVEPLLIDARAAKRERQRARDALGWLLPTVALHNLFDGLSDQGIEGDAARQRAARRFHDELRVAFYPFVFEERLIGAADIAALPTPAPSVRELRQRPAAWAALLLFAALGLGALWRSARRIG